jgi:hypothetical protein
MISSNKQLDSLSAVLEVRLDPGFATVVAFDYYDGPEKGFALFPSGAGVRFSSLGDSRSRLFRAFELVAIDGDWRKRILVLQEAVTAESRCRVIVPADSEALTLLERDVFDTAAAGYYVSLGSPNLDWLGVSPVSKERLDALREVGDSFASFRSVHQILNDKKRMSKANSGARG